MKTVMKIVTDSIIPAFQHYIKILSNPESLGKSVSQCIDKTAYSKMKICKI